MLPWWFYPIAVIAALIFICKKNFAYPLTKAPLNAYEADGVVTKGANGQLVVKAPISAAFGTELPLAMLKVIAMSFLSGKLQGRVKSFTSEQRKAGPYLSADEVSKLPRLSKDFAGIPGELESMIRPYANYFNSRVYKVTSEGVDALEITDDEIPPFFLVATVAVREGIVGAANAWFPVDPFGLIHVKTRVEFLAGRKLTIADLKGMTSNIDVKSLELSDRGIETQVVQEFRDASGKPLHRCTEFLLSRDPEWVKRRARERKNEPKTDAQDSSSDAAVAAWEVSFDLTDKLAGRNYAGITGDYNPHHVWPVAAKLMGFRACIAQGLLSAEIVGRELRRANKMPSFDTKFAIDATYKLPLYFPQRSLRLFEKKPNEYLLETKDKKPVVEIVCSQL